MCVAELGRCIPCNHVKACMEAKVQLPLQMYRDHQDPRESPALTGVSVGAESDSHTVCSQSTTFNQA